MPYEAFRPAVAAHGRSWRHDDPMGAGHGSTRSKALVVYPETVCTDANRVIGKIRVESFLGPVFAGEDNQSRLCFLPNSALFRGKTGLMGYEKVPLPPRTIGWKGF
jgi:hypothetical protein